MDFTWLGGEQFLLSVWRGKGKIHNGADLPPMSKIPGTSEQNTSFLLPSSGPLYHAKDGRLYCITYHLLGLDGLQETHKLPTIMEECHSRYLTFPVQFGKLIKS